MIDLIIIPTYYRPEFLHLCFEAIAACPQSEQMDFWVCADSHTEDRSDKLDWEAGFKTLKKDQGLVLSYWQTRLGSRLRIIQRQPHNFYGNTLNILEAYKEAYYTDYRFIYLIEDDIIIKPDFFEWHEGVQDGRCFCSVGYKGSEFVSLGVCWNRGNLGRLLLHSTPEYYVGMDKYLSSCFPDSKYSNNVVEQDGLIRRIIERDNLYVPRPDENKCYHVGAYSYHRSVGEAMPTGDFQSRLEFWRETISTHNWMHDFFKDLDIVPAKVTL